MQPLTALIRGTQADDPLARALEAILDSGLVIFSRDTEGHFVQLSEVLSERVGIIADSGTSQPRNLRVFDENGRLLPGSEYPAAITRRTGTAQREVLRRLVSDDDREIWLRMSTLPLERGPEGWSVLTVGSDVTDLQERIAAAERNAEANRALLALGERIANEPLEFGDLRELFHEPLATLLPQANVSLALRQKDEYQSFPLAHGYGTAMNPIRGRYTADQRERWTAAAAHVNRDVQDTDIYGARVVAEFPHQIKTLVIAPCFDEADPRAGAIIAYGEHAGMFDDQQVTGLEIAARMLGRAVPDAEPHAQAS